MKYRRIRSGRRPFECERRRFARNQYETRASQYRRVPLAKTRRPFAAALFLRNRWYSARRVHRESSLPLDSSAPPLGASADGGAESSNPGQLAFGKSIRRADEGVLLGKTLANGARAAPRGGLREKDYAADPRFCTDG